MVEFWLDHLLKERVSRMVAELKSHVLRREEKGMFGIPFKRLLGAGIGGIVIFMIARMVFPVGAIPFGGIGFIAFLILSAVMIIISLTSRSKNNQGQIEIEIPSFNLSRSFIVGATIICGILAALYTAFW